MKRVTIVAVLLASCGPQVGAGNEAAPAAVSIGEAQWSFERNAAGAALTFTDQGRAAIRLICSKDGRLLVNVPGFDPIGSEERLSLGSGETVVALVADVSGDPVRGGVTASAPQPSEIKALLVTPLRASYGAQSAGPYPAVPVKVQRLFVEACSASATAHREASGRPAADTHPCLVQDGQRLRQADMRAIGTEPFWGAKVQGRCVTYSTPEDQAGTRIWTKVETGPRGPVFVGSFQGKPFVLRLQPAAGCSDGMSDRKYDWEAKLTVAGEERRGCADRV